MSEKPDMHEVQPNGQGYEERDVSIRGVTIFGVALFALCVVSLVLMAWLFDFLYESKSEGVAVRHPMAPTPERRLPPQPRLQVRPEMDLQQLRAMEDSLLHSYGWVIEENGIVRIPIEEAVERILEQGLPHRKQNGDERP